MSLLPFLLDLAIIIVAAKAAGYLSTRLGQPAVLGELVAGLLLGPTVLDMQHWPMFSDAHLGETISHLSHLGVLFLMFLAGLEVDLESLRQTGRPARALPTWRPQTAPTSWGLPTITHSATKSGDHAQYLRPASFANLLQTRIADKERHHEPTPVRDDDDLDG